MMDRGKQETKTARAKKHFLAAKIAKISRKNSEFRTQFSRIRQQLTEPQSGATQILPLTRAERSLLMRLSSTFTNRSDMTTLMFNRIDIITVHGNSFCFQNFFLFTFSI
jgi:hypothetical protein